MQNNKNKNHKYNKAFGFVTWENSDKKLTNKSCKGSFFKGSYIKSPPLIPSTPKESEALLKTDVSSTDQSSGWRKSSRQSLQSNQAERKCIICNKDRYTNGRLDHLQNISLKRGVDGTYKAKDTLKEYAEIYSKSKNERFIDSGNPCAKRVCIRSYYGSHFSTFWLNTGKCGPE